MPGDQPESQEEILAASEAALTDEDIPPEDDAFGWPDPDFGMPPELLALSDAELTEVLDEIPAQPVQPAWPLSYRTCEPDWFVPGDGPDTGTGFGQGGVLDEMAAGIALAEFTDDAYGRLGTLDDNSLVGALRAWRRLASWATARELATTTELARRRPAPGTPPAAPGQLPRQLSEFIAAEVGLALTLTGMSARTQLDLALDLHARPAIAAALEAGRIDLPKTRIMISMICPLEPAHADAVEAAVLPEAPGLTTGELRAALLRAILAVDPDAARRRQEESQKDARVERWIEPEGTATLAGRYLPPAEVLAADKRLCTIAKSWKKQGAQGGMDLLRAHVYLALLLGQPVDTPPLGLLSPPGTPVPCPQDRPAPARHGSPPYAEAPAPRPEDRPAPARDGSPPYAPCPQDKPAPAQHGSPQHAEAPTPRPEDRPAPARDGSPPYAETPAPCPQDKPAPAQHGSPQHTGAPAPRPEDRPAPARDGSPSPAPWLKDRPVTAGNGSPAAGTADPGYSPTGGTPHLPEEPVPAGLRRPFAGVPLPPLTGEVHLTIPMATLLGVADCPGEEAGFGPVHADTARRLADAMATNRRTRWGVIITNQDGRAMGFGGRVRARPLSAGGWKITLTTEPIAPYP